MPMMRIKDQQYEKLEKMAVAETAKQQRIVSVSEYMHGLIEKEFQRLSKGMQNSVKPETKREPKE